MSNIPVERSRKPAFKKTVIDAAVSAARRNKGFDETHQAIIRAAIHLVSEKGIDALSMAEVARATGVDRKTVYYHFADRNDLVKSTLQWSSEELTKGFTTNTSRADRTAHISRFVLENPEIIKLWIADFIAPGDIRSRYPNWDALVEGMRQVLAHHGDAIDVEVYCTIMLTSAFIAPRVYRNSVRPDLDIEAVTEAFSQEQTRMLSLDAHLPQEKGQP